MTKEDYQLWIDYHQGKINRPLTKEEFREIRASEFGLHLLVPQSFILQLCGGLEQLKAMNHFQIHQLASYIAEAQTVTEDIVLIQIDNLVKKETYEEPISVVRRNRQKKKFLRNQITKNSLEK